MSAPSSPSQILSDTEWYLPMKINIVWVLLSTVLVWLMIPGLGFFYSGLARRKNALSLVFISFLAVPIVSLQWFLVGYSLTYSPTGGPFIGNFDLAFLRGISTEFHETRTVPLLVHSMFQCMFAVFPPALIVGGSAERARIIPTLIFFVIWTTLVYDFIAYWCWSENGWIAQLKGLDFAGGAPIHISSGASALAYSLILGPRRDLGAGDFRPHNIMHVILGAALLWFGWFGFNGGSVLSVNLRTASVCTVTNLAASIGGLTWMFIDYRLDHKLSVVGFCSGALAGLVCITPAAGFVNIPSSLVFGFLPGVICNFAIKLKAVFNYDDALDVFAIHGIGGTLGSLLTGIFAQKDIAFLDGFTVIDGGWLDGNFIQLLYQLYVVLATYAYSFVTTCIILLIMDKIPGLALRIGHDEETSGIDLSELSESIHITL